MGFQDDWMMRQIEMMTKFIANVVFGRSTKNIHYEIMGDISDSSTLSPTDEIYLKLSRLIREGRYGEAEDLLFENAVYSEKYIELAVDFYTKLNSFSDEQLESGGFSRDEVYDGYVEIMSLLGVPVDVFGQGSREDYNA